MAPYDASQITLDNPTRDTVSVRVGGAAPVEIKPQQKLSVPRPLADETVVECLGPGVAELSWRITPDAAVGHPDYARFRERGLVGNPIRDLITEAWEKAFSQGTVAAGMGRFDPLTLPDTNGIGAQQGFNQICPNWSNGSEWADGDARINLTSLLLRNLTTARPAGDPVFSEDGKVTFSMRFDRLRLDGKCTMIQRCCEGWLAWCWYTRDHSTWEDFELTMDSVVLWFDAMVVPVDPRFTQIAMGGTRLEIEGARTVHFPGHDWLPDWLKYLEMSWSRIEQFTSGTVTATEHALGQPAILTTIQTVVNGWLRLIPMAGTP